DVLVVEVVDVLCVHALDRGDHVPGQAAIIAQRASPRLRELEVRIDGVDRDRGCAGAALAVRSELATGLLHCWRRRHARAREVREAAHARVAEQVAQPYERRLPGEGPRSAADLV